MFWNPIHLPTDLQTNIIRVRNCWHTGLITFCGYGLKITKNGKEMRIGLDLIILQVC